MGLDQKLDAPLPASQVPEAEVTEKNAHNQELEAREQQLRDREAELELRERHVNELEERLK